MPLRAVLLLALVSAAATGCRDAPPTQTSPQRNLVFVLVDTLRRDHLGTYGHARDTTPFIDSLAENGLVFERAIAQSPWTAPSMASIWTSRYPTEVGVRTPEDERGVRNINSFPASGMLDGRPAVDMQEGAVTLAELLRGAGYRTIAVTSNINASDTFHLLSGFESDTFEHAGAEVIVSLALERLDEILSEDPGAPFMLYLHFIDLHEPIDPPAPYAAMFPASSGSPRGEEHRRWRFTDARGLESDAFRDFREHKIGLYDGALRYVDDQLRRLADELAQRGAREDALFVIASDHGEEFWEHARFARDQHLDPRGAFGVSHGHSMFREQLDVPLVFHGPGVPRGRVESQVRNLDIAPSILGVLEVPHSSAGFRGSDVIAHYRRGFVPDQLALSMEIAYGANAVSLQDARYKLVEYARTRSGKTRFLFDKLRDPEETLDVSAAEPRVTERLQRRLREALADVEASEGSAAELDAEAREELRALGYAD